MTRILNLMPNKMPFKKPTASRFLVVKLLLLTAVSLSPLLSSAQEVSAQRMSPQHVNTQIQISMEKAIGLSLQQHPDLKAFVHDKLAMQAYEQQATVGSIPTIGLTIEDALGTGSHSGIKSAQSTMSIAWVLDNEVVEQKINLAKSKSVRVDIERESKALDIAADTAKLFVTTLILEQRLKLAERSVQQASNVYQQIKKRVEASKTTNVDLLLGKNEVIERELIVEDLTHELDASRYLLFAQWNANEQTAITGDLLQLPSIPTFDELTAKITSNPAFKLFASNARIAQSEISAARVQVKPVWQFNAGVRRYETTDDFGLVAGVSIPFGDENRNSGTIRALNAKITGYEAQAQALEKRLIKQVYTLYQELNHSQHVISTLAKQSIPTLEQAVQEAQKAYQVGSFSFMQWQSIQQKLLNTQENLLAAYLNLHLNNIEIERLTGGTL
ncbi:TolC family protein [Thalassotalea sp. ND16A]|uniref:TolC family protein n=1 Tax=Thalassotalea sp. ND16A TaxID=1535422 RepID=UPI00051D9888|nr:TolC family protein [Thalassotalea sp. ND16A]KGJ94198.1 hypothetical protein ND16A_1454 [Thalassotalea sp. ND16A]